MVVWTHLIAETFSKTMRRFWYHQVLSRWSIWLPNKASKRLMKSTSCCTEGTWGSVRFDGLGHSWYPGDGYFNEAFPDRKDGMHWKLAPWNSVLEVCQAEYEVLQKGAGGHCAKQTPARTNWALAKDCKRVNLQSWLSWDWRISSHFFHFDAFCRIEMAEEFRLKVLRDVVPLDMQAEWFMPASWWQLQVWNLNCNGFPWWRLEHLEMIEALSNQKW